MNQTIKVRERNTPQQIIDLMGIATLFKKYIIIDEKGRETEVIAKAIDYDGIRYEAWDGLRRCYWEDIKEIK